jgi:hypothetical protein
MGSIIDLKTGAVFMLPFALGVMPDHDTKSDSALLMVGGKFEYNPKRWSDPSRGKQGRHYFIFDGAGLRYLTTIEDPDLR